MLFSLNDNNEIYFNLEALSSSDTYVKLLSDVLLQYTGREVFEDESWGLSIFTKNFEQFYDPWDSRYVVSLPNYEIQVPKDTWGYPRSRIVNMLIMRLQYLKTSTVLAKEDAHIVGLWVDKGVAYLDFCKTFDSLEDAMAYAKAGKQLAIYDRFRQETIEIE